LYWNWKKGENRDIEPDRDGRRIFMMKACSRESLKKFTNECLKARKPIDTAIAEIIVVKIAIGIMTQKDADSIISGVEHMLKDYREILITEIEERYGKIQEKTSTEAMPNKEGTT
jgi:hypothetical protein